MSEFPLHGPGPIWRRIPLRSPIHGDLPGLPGAVPPLAYLLQIFLVFTTDRSWIFQLAHESSACSGVLILAVPYQFLAVICAGSCFT